MRPGKESGKGGKRRYIRLYVRPIEVVLGALLGVKQVDRLMDVHQGTGSEERMAKRVRGDQGVGACCIRGLIVIVRQVDGLGRPLPGCGGAR